MHHYALEVGGLPSSIPSPCACGGAMYGISPCLLLLLILEYSLMYLYTVCSSTLASVSVPL